MELTITVTPTPFGLTQGVAVTGIRLVPVPTSKDRRPQAMHPTRTEAASAAGLRAWFTPPGRRFHLLVTFADGSTQTVDIYRPVPPADPKPRIVVPSQRLAPVGRWTADYRTDRLTTGDPMLSLERRPRSRAKISIGVQRILARCLQKQPDARFQSARDLEFALDTLW